MASLSVPFFQQHLLTYVSVSHFDNSCNSFKHFHYYYYICYGDLWWVIFDVTIILVLGCHEPHPQKMVNLTDKCCVSSDYSIHWPFPISFLLVGPPCSLRHNNSEIRSVSDPKMSLAPLEREYHASLTLKSKAFCSLPFSIQYSSFSGFQTKRKKERKKENVLKDLA